MDSISQKAITYFKGKVVRKDLTSLMKRGANVPTFVLEYLLGMYCATDDEATIAAGIQKIQKILTENYVHPSESERIKSLIRERGEYTIIDKITASLDEYNDCYSATFTNLEIDPFVLPDEYVTNNTKILMGGIWCMVRIAYRHVSGTTRAGGSKKRKNPWESPFKLVSLKPIQMPNLDVEDMIGKRCQFQTDEWIRLLLRSSGIEAAELNDKERFHYLERLVPLVERNYNLCELGPRGTGKSHIYKEISPYSILMSGGRTSIANLFYNLQSKKIGLVGHWDCVAFDEVAGMHFRDTEAIQIMKDYMASGSFARGRDQINADASMVFVGNTNDTVENILKTSHLFDAFPVEFHNDSAFFDRMHYYLPGWEVPKIRADYLTEEYGLITDCLAEFSREMRKRDFTYIFDQWFSLNRSVTTRDEIAIRKTVSGLVKLIYPDKSFTKEELEIILTYAIEGRRRVKEQLRRMAGEEFSDVDMGYITDDHSEVIVYLPEQSDETLISPEALPAGHVYAIGKIYGADKTAVYRLENKSVPGNGRIEVQGVRGSGSGAVTECINAAWVYFTNHSDKIRRPSRITERDFLVYYASLQDRNISADISVAELIGLCSAFYETPVLPSLAIAGELTLSGTINELKNLSEYVRTAVNAGAHYLLIPQQTKNDFDGITDNDLKRITPIYYSDPIEAVKIALQF